MLLHNKKKECVAMLLAGGQGSRLLALTENTAKPAVSFGGKYRIIDFTLSNCANSGIDTVGVLTQYQPLELNEYIGNGEAWDLDSIFGGVTILPPYRKSRGSDWYRGTANAVYQNIPFLNSYDPSYVLVLSGDHIYKMDYSKMLDYHKNTGAVCTIASLEVDISEASRFGVLDCTEDGRITDFSEKPKNPKSNKVSMGIYIFSKDVLIKYLEEDEADEKSKNDFGGNIIPAMLARGERLFVYPFKGYWKDVGTIESLWQANTDLLSSSPALDLYDRRWRIYTKNYALQPQYLCDGCNVSNSIITEGSRIYGTVIDSVISRGVTVEKGAVIKDSVIFEGCRIGEDSLIEHSIVDSFADIPPRSVIGSPEGRGGKITVVTQKN